MSEEPEKIESIENHMTRTTWLHFVDALEIGKVAILAGRYRQGEGTDLMLSHYVDVFQLRPLLHDLSWNKPVNFTEYKGTPKPKQEGGEIRSHVLNVNSGKNNKGEPGIWWSLSNGQGKLTQTGAVLPAGGETQKIGVFINQETMRGIAYSLLEYFVAAQTASLLAAHRPSRKEISPEVAAMTIEELNDDLFGPDFAKPQPIKIATIAPEAAVAKGLFLDGKPCPDELKGLYDEYVAATRTAPRSQEHAVNWRYQN
jgi:hypothetical protein